MKEYFEAMKIRKSVRKYSGKLTDGELAAAKEQLCRLVPLCEDIEVAFEIVPAAETNCKWNAEYCLLCYSEEKPLWLENAGYMLEQWDLFLAGMGIGVCWYGWGRSDKKMSGKTYVIMLSFGKCDGFRTDEAQFSRRDVKDFWQGDCYCDVAHWARLAPSACNSQPWLVKQTANVVEVYQHSNFVSALAQKLSKWFNKMDLGIFLTFLEASFEQHGYTFERELNADHTARTPLARYTVHHE